MNLTQREFVILGLLLRGELHGRGVRIEYEKRTGKKFPAGSLYVTLDRMVDKGYLDTRMGESAHPKGGNRRRYFRINGKGTKAFNEMRELAFGADAAVGGRELA